MSTEALPAGIVSFDAANRETLATHGAGTLLLDAYIAATALDPRLAGAEVVALPPEASPLAMAHQAALSDNGNYQVRLAIGDPALVRSRFATSIGAVRGAQKFFAQCIGLDLAEQDITPAFFETHALLHEFGHIGPYMDAEASTDPQEALRQAKEEKDRMPLGNIAVSTLLDPTSPARRAIDANLEPILKFHRVASFDELLEKQHVAYRMTRSERDADLFAAAVLRANPALLEAIMSARS